MQINITLDSFFIIGNKSFVISDRTLPITVILCSTPFGRSRLGFFIFYYLLRKEKNKKNQPNYCPIWWVVSSIR